MKKTTIILVFLLVLMLAVNCFADAEDAVFTNNGLILTVSSEYADQVIVSLSDDTGRNILFSVYEKASIEAMKETEGSFSGAGWLFSIGTVTEEQYHQMIGSDMTGVEGFAKDGNGTYYLFYHPTDVRMVREDYSNVQEDLKVFGALNEWAWSVKDTFTAENGLETEKYGNSMVEIYLARLMYRDDVNYTVSTTEYGPMEPHGVKAADYIEPMVHGAAYTYLRDEEAPDGEYVVLNFPDDDIRFDFFMASGKQNYIRQVWANGRWEELYKAELTEGEASPAEIMNDLYHDMVLANSLGYTADDLVGVWAEKIAGRGAIKIRKSESGDSYNVSIHWGSSAFESYNWTMTAVPAGDGAELRYEDCKLVDLVFTSETESTETVVYENGTGSFTLLSTYELLWNDETGHAADDTVFIHAGL